MTVVELKGEAGISTSSVVVLEFKGPFTVTDYETKFLEKKESGELHLLNNDKGWIEIYQNLSKYAESVAKIVVVMDQQSFTMEWKGQVPAFFQQSAIILRQI